jgi:CheY-like chemotaxis protein
MTENPILPACRSTSTPPRFPTNPPQRILVVDDDSDVRKLYSDLLAGLLYHVDVVEDGAAGWEALQANNYNLLITENDLPKVTGIELVEKLRSARLALPVVMAAGRLPTHELARNPSLQLAATLSKPFVAAAFLDTVQSVLRASDGDHTQITPSPNWRIEPTADSLRPQ